MSPDRSPTIGVIDIGTNSVKLLTGRVQRGEVVRVHCVHFARATTRLGGALTKGRRIPKAAIDDTARVVKRFARDARRRGTERVFVFSTFASRKAVNAREVVAAIERSVGESVRVLGGRTEARMAYLSARQCARWRGARDVMVVDIGGGSTEVVLARRDEVIAAHSIALGGLHLTGRFLLSDPVAGDEFARLSHHIGSALDRLFLRLPTLEPRALELVGSGGAAATASWMAHGTRPGKATGDTITLGELRRLLRECRRLPVAERKRLPGLPNDRADIIVAGLAIGVALMERTGKRVLRINEGGVREGVLIHLSQNNLRW